MNKKQQKIYDRWYGSAPVSGWQRFLAGLFLVLTAIRRKLYRYKLFKTHQFRVPVIVIGNITVGGGGKTPLVIWLAQRLQQQGYQPGIVSRGYGGVRKVEPMLVTPGADPAASGDEPLLMAKSVAVPVMVAKKRSQAVNQLIANHSVDIILADDGLQHLAMDRQAEIIMMDAGRGIGNGLLLPAGPLREPIIKLQHVDLIIYKGKKADCHYYNHEIEQIYQLNKPRKTRTIDSLRNQKIIAVAGIAHPDSFFKMLAANGVAVVKQPKPDHYSYSAADFPDNELILMTEKDAIKCADIEHPDAWVVKTRIVVKPETVKAIDKLIQKVMS